LTFWYFKKYYYSHSFTIIIMSLSFVSSSVQVATDDGGYKETEIESKEKATVNARNQHKPLFEQLRANKEEEDAKRDEIQREMMRGTRALDAEDVAHLDAVEKQRLERERKVKEQTQSELELFRAARAMRAQQRSGSLSGGDRDDDDDDNGEGNSDGEDLKRKAEQPTTTTTNVPTIKPPVVPLIKVKKRKRRTGEENQLNTRKLVEKAVNPAEAASKPLAAGDNKGNTSSSTSGGVKGGPSGSLSGLLSGYGSSSDEDD
jgi:hypothetical protein